MQTLSQLRQRPHISVSQIRSFVQCPRKHRFSHIERIRPDFRPIALSFGTAFHAAIGEMLMTDPGIDEVVGVFTDSLEHDVLHGDVPVLFEDGEDLRACLELGRKMLAEFRRSVPMPDEVVGLELPFSIDLLDPSSGRVPDLPLIGAIDAIVVEAGKPVVWELKTAKRQWSADKLEFDMQPTAYAMGARKHGVDAPAKVLVTTKSKNPVVQVEEVTRNGRDERELAQVASSVIRAIEAGVDHPVRDWWCKCCPYAGRCA